MTAAPIDSGLPALQFRPPLVEGRFKRRYKRFFLDAKLPDGMTVVAHCPNTGSLTGCLVEGARVLLAPNDNPNRKLRFSWMMIELEGSWVGIDTSMAVPLVEHAIAAGHLPELAGYERMIREVPYGLDGKSRIDLLLSRGGKMPEIASPAKRPTTKAARARAARALPDDDERVYVEVKNTTLVYGQGKKRVAAFPDAVTERGLKHLHELRHVVEGGQRAAMVYVTQRNDCHGFVPADEIHPAYGEALREAVAAGVEAYCISCDVNETSMTPLARLPISL